MALLDGKQLRDQSTSLDKLRGNTGLVTFTTSATMSFAAGSVLRQADENILVGHDVVNKNYVDSVAQGLHIKESVHVLSSTPITLSGTQSIDNHPLQVGERVLVNGQDNANATASNGIYVVAAGAWSRATDSDGITTLPNGEVQLGDFVFVVEGQSYAGTGWVLNTSDSSDFYILVGTESQHWTQFSSAGVITPGDGLVQTGSDFHVNTGTGLTISSDQVVIANTGVTVSNYGSDDSVAAFTVNAQGQIVSAQSILIDITSSQVNNFTASAETAIFTDANFVDGTTVQFDVTAGDSTTAEVVLNSLTASRFDIINPASASQDWKLGYNSSGQFEWFDPSQIDQTAAGNGLTFSAGVFSVNTANGLTINGDNVEVDQTIAGQGLTFSAGVVDMVWGGTVSGTTFSNDAVAVVVDNTTIQINSSGQLTVVAGASQPHYQYGTMMTATTGNDANTFFGLALTPNDYSRIQLYVNGQLQRLGNGTKAQDCYFSNDGGLSAKFLSDLASSDTLYWNGNNAGFDLASGDNLDIVYEA